MPPRRRFFIIAIASCLLFNQNTCLAGDWEYWNAESIEGKFNDKCKAFFDEELRLNDDAKKLYYEHSELGLIYKPLDYLEVGASYRHIYEKKSGLWKRESMPAALATIRWSWQNLDFQDRSRFEFRIIEDASDSTRYANKLTIKFPIKLTKLDIQPYMADEIFWDFDAGELNKNRLSAGLEASITKNIKVDLFYLWQDTKKSGCWKSINAVGTKLKLIF